MHVDVGSRAANCFGNLLSSRTATYFSVSQFQCAIKSVQYLQAETLNRHVIITVTFKALFPSISETAAHKVEEQWKVRLVTKTILRLDNEGEGAHVGV